MADFQTQPYGKDRNSALRRPLKASRCRAWRTQDPPADISTNAQDQCLHKQGFAPNSNRFSILAELDLQSKQTKRAFDFVHSPNTTVRGRGKHGPTNTRVKFARQTQQHHEDHKSDRETTPEGINKKMAKPCLDREEAKQKPPQSITERFPQFDCDSLGDGGDPMTPFSLSSPHHLLHLPPVTTKLVNYPSIKLPRPVERCLIKSRNASRVRDFESNQKEPSVYPLSAFLVTPGSAARHPESITSSASAPAIASAAKRLPSDILATSVQKAAASAACRALATQVPPPSAAPLGARNSRPAPPPLLATPTPAPPSAFTPSTASYPASVSSRKVRTPPASPPSRQLTPSTLSVIQSWTPVTGSCTSTSTSSSTHITSSTNAPPLPLNSQSKPTTPLPRPTVQLPKPTVQLPKPTVQLPMSTVQLPMSTVQLPMSTVQLPTPSASAPMPAVQFLKPTPPPKPLNSAVPFQLPKPLPPATMDPATQAELDKFLKLGHAKICWGLCCSGENGQNQHLPVPRLGATSPSVQAQPATNTHQQRRQQQEKPDRFLSVPFSPDWDSESFVVTPSSAGSAIGSGFEHVSLGPNSPSLSCHSSSNGYLSGEWSVLSPTHQSEHLSLNSPYPSPPQSPIPDLLSPQFHHESPPSPSFAPMCAIEPTPIGDVILDPTSAACRKLDKTDDTEGSHAHAGDMHKPTNPLYPEHEETNGSTTRARESAIPTATATSTNNVVTPPSFSAPITTLTATASAPQTNALEFSSWLRHKDCCREAFNAVVARCPTQTGAPNSFRSDSATPFPAGPLGTSVGPKTNGDNGLDLSHNVTGVDDTIPRKVDADANHANKTNSNGRVDPRPIDFPSRDNFTFIPPQSDNNRPNPNTNTNTLPRIPSFSFTHPSTTTAPKYASDYPNYEKRYNRSPSFNPPLNHKSNRARNLSSFTTPYPASAAHTANRNQIDTRCTPANTTSTEWPTPHEAAKVSMRTREYEGTQRSAGKGSIAEGHVNGDGRANGTGVANAGEGFRGLGPRFGLRGAGWNGRCV